jgi:hypothetical protein
MIRGNLTPIGMVLESIFKSRELSLYANCSQDFRPIFPSTGLQLRQIMQNKDIVDKYAYFG